MGGGDFPNAAAAGWPLLGGEDIFVEMARGPVRGHYWRTPHADGPPVVICPGFTEFCEKYSMLAARLVGRGHDVLIIDWPGQGRSGHHGENMLAVHSDGFELHLAAAEALMAEAGIADKAGFILGHSMGGHLALRLAAMRQDRTLGAIIMAPMIAPPVMPVWGVRMLAWGVVMAGFGRRHAPGRGASSLAEERVFHQRNGLTRVKEGYELPFYWFDDAPELRRSGPTAGWVRAAYESCAKTTLDADWMRRLTVPVLALVAGDERIVHKPSIDRMLRCLPRCQRFSYAGARHELLHETEEVKQDLWERIEAFLGSWSPDGAGETN